MDESRTILIGIDNISTEALKSSPVLLWTLRHFAKNTDTLLLVHASKQLMGSSSGSASTSSTSTNASAAAQAAALKHLSEDALREMERNVAHTAQKLVEAHFPNNKIKVLASIHKGDPRDVLVKLAGEHNAAAVLVGSRGIGGVKRALLGSVSDHLARNCESTVVIVKT
ncbi:hypothetical protein HK102_012287 [Quaeritorhiza haematococci]|nr:hypothetical protein HK102_012287 [Quaeritorhiza haematococci]